MPGRVPYDYYMYVCRFWCCVAVRLQVVAAHCDRICVDRCVLLALLTSVRRKYMLHDRLSYSELCSCVSVPV